MKRVLSLFLALVMVLQYVPATVFAAAEDNLCAHHAEHTEDCGYAEEQPGSDCTHTHSMECYAVNECAHVHGEECAEACGHDCMTDVACWQYDRICGHESLSQCGQECFQPICAHAKGQHDGSCGYIPATEAQPCLYECAECAAPEEPAAEPAPSEEPPAEPAPSEEPPAELTPPEEPSTETTAPVEVAHEHEYTSDVTAPTCKEKGYTTYTCECGDSYVDDYLSAAGHKRSNGICTVCGDSFAGKKVSILSHSMSTYAGVSNNTSYNSTIGKNDVYYTEGRYGVYLKDTWWMQTIDALGMGLLVNNSWSGSCIFQPRKGEASVGYGDRAVNLHNDHTGEEPDVILVYLGCNDFAYFKDTFGVASSVDYDAIILDNGDGTFAYAVPTTACEAYAIMLHKVHNRYPDAEIYCMTSTARREVDYTGDTYPDAGQPTLYSAELHNVAKHFGFPVIDLENAISKEVEIFDKYIGDKRAHANALGMDRITNEVISVMLGRDAEIRHVTSEDDVVAQRAILLGGSYSAKVNLRDGYAVTVTMDGKDITAEAYKNGKITIQKVTGDIAVSVAVNRDPLNFAWELDDGALISTGASENSVAKLAGTISDDLISNGQYKMETPVLLKHDLPWALEWSFSGDWRGSVLASDPVQKTDGMHYISRTKGGQLCFGTWNGNQYDNYGVDLSSLNDQTHTYRLVNRIAADGSNMVWLYVDGTEIGPMNNYYIGSNSQNKTSDWVSGKDFVFSYIGMEGHPLNNCRMDYIKIQEDSHTHTYEASVTAPTCTEQGYTTYTCKCGDSYVGDYVDAAGHTYKNGICTGCGAAVSAYLQQLPEDLIGCTNLHDILTPVKGYYTATKYDTSNGAVLSVVIPVEPGDRIAASSFGSVSENMGSVDGIRVTYLLGDKIVISLSAGEVYNGYTKNGYITVPDGVDTVCVPWWKPSDSNWLTLSQISKDFVVHSPKTVSAQTPTCTENGYTAGEICEICDASLGSREEIPATGHDYNGNTCTICGTVNVLAILDGKYVSVLGDSISTFNGYSNDATVNTTIGGNGPRYDAGTADTKPGSYCLLESVDDAWWMHFANRSGMKLLVNNSWAGSQVFGGQTSDGRVIPAAYLNRCVNLHDNTLENNPGNAPVNPDVIFVYLGINDYNFNRSKVGTGTVDYAGLVNSNGTYATPATFGEAYGIMLHKMQKAYPNAEIFAMTLLPENLYSVDKVAWEQHNAYIRAAAEYYNIPVVDLAENCAITWENYSGYMIDKIHPTTAGMKLISDCMEAELIAYYKGNQNHTHSYKSVITAPTCKEKGYTTYTCECGDSYVDDYVDPTGEHTYENGICLGCGEAHPNLANYKGKVISILGDSISTFAGYIPAADGFNLEHHARYPQDNLLTDVNETWWMQVIHQLDAKLGINESWRSTEVYNYIDADVNSSYDGTKACMASTTRIQNIGSNGTPDVILFFGGTNDITQSRPVGTFDSRTAPANVDLTSVKWDTVADAYVNAIMRMQYYYPDAQIVAMLPFDRSSQGTAKVEKYNSLFISICEHYGVPYVDLRECGITNANLPDGTHPDATGMDYITSAVLDVLISDCKVAAGEHIVHSVTHKITDAKSSLGYYKGVSHGKPFATNITGENLKVTVIMGGVDITDTTYANGIVSVAAVTDDLVITVQGRVKSVYEDHIKQLPGSLCCSTNLWTSLVPENTYYTGSAWGNVSGNSVYSITIPVATGDQIWATSFQKSGANGGNRNGIRLTWFDENGVLESISPDNVYAEFVANASVTAPDGAVAVNVVMWNGKESNEVYILNRDHCYENGICLGCGEAHPNLANYEGKVISILGGSTCTFDGYIPEADGFNLAHRPRYPQSNLLTNVHDTWWMQVISELGAKLGINDSWAGSQVLNTLDQNSGDLGPDAAMASLTRIQNLGANGTPDIILFYGAMNDIGKAVALGTFDPQSAPKQVDLTATKWANLADAYVAAIMRMQYYYPDAQIVAMLPGPTASYYTEAERQKYCAVLKDICDFYDVTTIDLSTCGLTTADMPDGTHPNAAGMDYITAAVLETLLDECPMQRGENTVHSVIHELNGAKSSMGYYKGVSHGKSFATTISGDDLTVTVTMGGVDVTTDVYAYGKVTISNVTGDVVIKAKGSYNADGRLQQLPENYCCNTNLWAALEPVNEYYTTSGWGNNSNSNYSVTIPVTVGDHIWATSFGTAGTNGYTANAVRITWFSDSGVLKSVSRDDVYAEFKKNGYITVPEGAVALNIPMKSDDDSWEIYILNREHTYENGICLGCGAAQPGPIITQQPVDGEAKMGEKYMVEVKAEGEGLTYQWYFCNQGSKTWYKSSVRDNTYDDVMTTARAGREVYCVITDANGNSVTTETAKLICVPGEELAITKQPENGEAVMGERFCVTVEAKGDNLKYQWYFRNKGATVWTKSGVRDNTYDDVMTTARADREIYCVITDAYGNKVTSDTVKLIRIPMKLEITQQPADSEASLGDKFCVTVLARGEGLKYQWYYRNAGGLIWYKSGVRDNTYDDTMTKARMGREVYCVITDTWGNKVTTETAKLIGVPAVELEILTQPEDDSAPMGENFCITVEAQGDGLKYQWYFRNKGDSVWYKSGVKDNTYDDVMTKARAGRDVYCVITDAYGNQLTTQTAKIILK